MGRIVGFLKRRIIIQNGIHQLARRKATRKVAIAIGRGNGTPPFHRTVLDAHRDTKVLGVPEDRRKDLLEFQEVLLETVLLVGQVHIVSDERSADNVVDVTTEHRRDADQLEDVVLVDNLKVRIAADQIVVGADGNPEPFAVADLNHLLRAVWREVIVVEMCRDVVLTVRVATEDAELETLGPDALRALDDGLEVRIGREGAGHQPDRVVAGLRLGLVRERTLGKGSGCGKRRSPLEEFTSVHKKEL